MSVILTNTWPMAASFKRPAALTRKFSLGASGYGAFPLPTDPVGQVTLFFSGIKPGSEIQIIGQGNVVLGAQADVTGIPSFTLDRYSIGSTGNDIRIFIIALGFEVVDFKYTLPQANATIPVFQRVDRNYRNL